MSKHTPGPWYFGSNERQPQIASESDPRGRTIALVYDGTDDETKVANANLIAAAPELLQILETIVEDVGYRGGGAKLCKQFLSRATIAIHKAKGET